jgi:putative transposase
MDTRYPRSIRLKGFDYAQAGAYFVTICTQDRVCLFGDVVDGAMILGTPGQIVLKAWCELPRHYPHVRLDAFVVMPNHVHVIIMLYDSVEAGLKPAATTRHALPEVVRALKTFSSRRINAWRETPGISFWQRNYYEHVIRNDNDLDRIRGYIATNPPRWALDRDNPQRTGRSAEEDALFGFHQTS